MNLKERSKPVAVTLAAAVLGAMLVAFPVAGCAADVPAGSSAVKPARSREEIVKDYRDVSNEVDNLTESKTLADEKQLVEIAPKAVPVIKHQLNVIDELQAARIIGPEQGQALQVHPTAAALSDERARRGREACSGFGQLGCEEADRWSNDRALRAMDIG